MSSLIYRHVPANDLQESFSASGWIDDTGDKVDTSYNIEVWKPPSADFFCLQWTQRITDIKAVVPEWDDEEVDVWPCTCVRPIVFAHEPQEIIVISPKEYHPLPTILEDADEPGNGTGVRSTGYFLCIPFLSSSIRRR